jgi:hypothetical protein
MVDSADFRGAGARLAAVSLVVGLVAAPAPASAQQPTALGIARAASLMKQIATTCAGFDVDADLAARSEKAFLQTGGKAFGKQAFDRLLAIEYERRAQEVRTKGSDRWCADQREALAGTDGAALFRK